MGLREYVLKMDYIFVLASYSLDIWMYYVYIAPSPSFDCFKKCVGLLLIMFFALGN